MKPLNPSWGASTLVNQYTERSDAEHAHVTPIYQSSTFFMPDVASGAGVFQGAPGYVYTRYDNPNLHQVAAKIAALEGIDLLRASLQTPPDEIVHGMMFGSGMAAITSAILARLPKGGTVIAQSALYSAAYTFLSDMAARFNLRTVFVEDPTPEAWEQAFADNPDAALAYAETPANPVMRLVDLAAAAQTAHRHGAWLMVDNTFATPFCQRPLALGADAVIHSTTKYLAGHGLVIGGVVVSPHLDYMKTALFGTLKVLGGCASPFDAWLTNIGLKTFELRMQRHCQNALQVAQFLAQHPAVAAVHYPGLPTHPGHDLACRQMKAFGGMLSFELKGGFDAGVRLMERVRVATLAVSLGNVDTLICHPASTTHSSLTSQARFAMGISDGLVRFSVGVENVEDILADLDQGLAD